MRIDTQLKQTIISTAAVSIGIGLFFILPMIAVTLLGGNDPESKLTTSDIPDVLFIFSSLILFCVLVFGIFPWLIQQALIWISKSRTKSK